MNRDEYMRQLGDALSFMEEEARSAALSFYGEMMEDRMEDGMTEEEAVATLEQPQSIAARLRAESERQEQPRPERRPAEGDYEQHTLTHPAAAIRAVRIRAKNMPVVVKPCAGDQLTLSYYSCERDKYTASIHQGVLTLDHESRGWDVNISANIFGLGFLFSNRANATIELSLPADSLIDLQVETSNDAVSVTGMRALCDVSLRSSNGRMTLENVACKALDAKTSNSRLTLTGVSSKRALYGKTSNSRLEAAAVRSGEDMTLATTNARATVAQAAAGGKMTIITSNGAIAVERLSAPALTLRTSNSNIKGVLPGRQADWAIECSASNGHSSLPKHQEGVKPLDVHTSNGSVNLTFEG